MNCNMLGCRGRDCVKIVWRYIMLLITSKNLFPQEQTVRLRSMSVTPDLVSTMASAMTCWETTVANVLQVCAMSKTRPYCSKDVGNLCLLYPWLEKARHLVAVVGWARDIDHVDTLDWAINEAMMLCNFPNDMALQSITCRSKKREKKEFNITFWVKSL